MNKENIKIIDDSYFGTIHQSNNEKVAYTFEPNFFGDSNTDQSYYEPQSTRIANMRKSASGLSSGVYDFQGDKNIDPRKIDMNDYSIPVGRASGATFEEMSQLQTNNAENIISQSKVEEQKQADKKAAKNEMIADSKAISQALSSGSESSEN